jgi:hypothetical protein
MKLSRFEFFKAVIGGILGLGLLTTVRTAAAAGGCCKCGCPQATKVCRLVCEEKKVQVTLWGVRDEDFCVPGPSKVGCRDCEVVADPKENDKTPCYEPKKFSWTQWIPSGCPTMFTKQKLMKKVVTKTVPSYKWVVEDLCAECEKAAEKVHPSGYAGG